MRSTRLASMAVLLILGVAFTRPAMAQNVENMRPRVVSAALFHLAATVQAIDLPGRTLTLGDAKGNSLSLKIARDAKDFGKVKVGDRVVVEHYEEVVIFVRERGEPQTTEESQPVVLTPAGSSPDGIIVNTVEVTAKVPAIDYRGRKIMLVDQRGTPSILRVDQDVQGLYRVRVGEEVVVRYTEAVAISIQKIE